jgi:glycosyltransferase involved in cell wall biosynthesis
VSELEQLEDNPSVASSDDDEKIGARMTQKPPLIIEFLSEGHRALHVCHLVRFGLAENQGSMRFLLPLELRDSVRARLSPEECHFFDHRVRVIEEDPAWLAIARWVKDKRLAQFIYVECLNIRESRDHRLLYLYLESAIYQLALCPLPRFSTSGLMFRPTFYYRQKRMLGPGGSHRALFILKWLVAYSCAKRPGMERIFLLDPLAEEYAKSQWRSKKFTLVPDPLGPESDGTRPVGCAHPIAERPVSFLIAGALAPRKGLHSTVDALAGSSEQTKRNVRLLIVGKPENGSTDYVQCNLTRLKQMGIQVATDLRFVSDLELDRCLSESNVVLTPYRGFKGSSGIVIRAAHFGKPVISTDEGLLGHLVQRYKLGETIDLGTAEQFSRCFDRIVSTGTVGGFDPTSAREFADSCDPGEFARLLSADLSLRPASARR